jgi:LysM repeat protein
VADPCIIDQYNLFFCFLFSMIFRVLFALSCLPLALSLELRANGVESGTVAQAPSAITGTLEQRNCGGSHVLIVGETLKRVVMNLKSPTNLRKSMVCNLRRKAGVPSNMLFLNSDTKCPNFRTYRVVFGDSMFDIGKKNGVTGVALLDCNPQVTDTDAIQPGTLLRVPVKP